MKQRAASAISGIGSILAGVTVLYFFFRNILPLTDVFVPDKEFPYDLVYAAAAGAAAFLLAAGWKKKNKAWQAMAGLLLLGIPLLRYLLDGASFDYAPIRLRMIGRGLIPAAFLLLGILALRGFRRVHGILLAVFAGLGLYHLFLAVKTATRLGDVFASARPADAVIALILAAVFLFLAWASFRALRRGA